MVKNECMKFLVNKEQGKIIRFKASSQGYKTVSAYLRNIAIRGENNTEEMIREMHNKIMQNE